MDWIGDFAETQETISQALVGTIRTATQTSAQDTEFYRSLDPELGAAIDRQNARLSALTQRLLRRCSPSAEINSLSLSDVESIETKWRTFVDVADSLLERADAYLDEYSGLIKRSSPKRETPAYSLSQRSHGVRARSIAKPQLQFQVKPSNDEAEPFEPILTSKPHAIIPLEQSKAIAPNELGNLQYQHPYAAEIARYQFPSSVYTEADPKVYTPFETTTADFIDDMDGIHQMLEELKKADVIAIDLEHHDAHSYVGIVSLMQISTRDHDWLIDTLKPWRRKLQVLNQVFADPNILKVFHGAHMDIMWLQRDFGLYVVGLFDTHHASRVLGYAGGSLAFLLKKFINFDAQKQYQTADWRIRPLPQEMFAYARSDTHFLLYIYDCMRNELISNSDLDEPGKNLIQEVLIRSKETAMQRYEHSFYDETRGMGRGGWLTLLQRTARTFSKEQYAVFRKVHQWRDRIARQEDESPFQIMANHSLFEVARSLPRDLPALLSILHPISQAVRLRASDLFAIIHDAATLAAEDPNVNEILSNTEVEIGSKLVSPPLDSANTTTAGTQLDKNPASSVNGRADFSQFWGSTLSSQNKPQVLPNESRTIFETTPHVANARIASSSTTGRFLPERCFDKGSLSLSTAPGPRIVSAINSSVSERNLNGDSDNIAGAMESAAHDQIIADPASSNENSSHMQRMKRRAESKLGRPISDADEETFPTSASQGVSAGSAFDYTAAPSVLHAKKTNFKSQGKAGEEQTPFNLHSQGAEVAPGIGKVKRPKVGKSATFK